MKTPVTNTDDPAVERNISRSDMDVIYEVLASMSDIKLVPEIHEDILELKADMTILADGVAVNTTNVQEQVAIAVDSAISASSSNDEALLSATSASTSATIATNASVASSSSAQASADSAVLANQSASSASTSANEASISEVNALASQESATLSEQSALQSKLDANASATSASNSEAISTQNAIDAAESASLALSSASDAEFGASMAETAATNALASATSAMTHATTATTKASEASVSASDALSYKDIAVSAANSITNMQVATGLPNSAVTWDGTTLTVPKGIGGIDGIDGTSIVSVIRTSGTGTAGTTDTYTITYTDNSTSTFTVYNGADGTGSGDMNKSIYDINNSGVVDNAEKVNGLTVQTAVPTGAVFTDTVYDDTGVLKDTDIDISIQRYDVNTVIDSIYVHTDNNFTNTLKSKLDSLSNYTKPISEPISYISGLDSALNSKVDKVAGKGLSTEDYTTGEKTKLSTLENYTLPIATNTIVGGVKVGSGLTISNGLLSVNSGGIADSVEWTGVINKPTTLNGYGILDAATSTHIHTDASVTVSGFMSASDKVKLNGLSNYVKPVNESISYITGLQTALDGKVTMTDVNTAINNVVGAAPEALNTLAEIASQLANDESAVSALTTTVSNKVDKVAGKQLSTEDYTTVEKSKLAGIADNANNYTLPVATSTVKGGVNLYSDVVQTVASNAVSTTANRTYGLQLNSAGQVVVNVPWTDTGTVYTHPTADGYLHVPATSTTNNGKVLMAGATAGSVSWQTIPSGVTDHTLLTNIGTNTHAQIDTALTRLVNTSGTNTGDQTITLTGDVTGSGTGSFSTTLKNTGTAGTYKSVTTDSQGRVTSGTNPTTIAGFGITDVYTKTEVDIMYGDIASALDTINGEVV